MTCSEAADISSSVRGDDASCVALNLGLTLECGCPYRPPEDLPCPLCVGGAGSMPDPALALDPDDPTSACYGMELSNADEEDGLVCAAWQASAGRACGCNRAPEPA